MRQFTLVNLFLWCAITMALSQTLQENGKTDYGNNDVLKRKIGRLISFTQGGVLLGNLDQPKGAPFILNTSLNYAFHKNLSAGVGVGVEFMRETHLPVTANLLYQFNNKNVTPFVMLQSGYQVALEKESGIYVRNGYWHNGLYNGLYGYSRSLDAKGGFMINPSVGVIFYSKRGIGFSLAAGYRFQKLNYKGEDDYKLHIDYNRLSLLLGFIF